MNLSGTEVVLKMPGFGFAVFDVTINFSLSKYNFLLLTPHQKGVKEFVKKSLLEVKWLIQNSILMI